MCSSLVIGVGWAICIPQENRMAGCLSDAKRSYLMGRSRELKKQTGIFLHGDLCGKRDTESQGFLEINGLTCWAPPRPPATTSFFMPVVQNGKPSPAASSASSTPLAPTMNPRYPEICGCSGRCIITRHQSLQGSLQVSQGPGSTAARRGHMTGCSVQILEG